MFCSSPIRCTGALLVVAAVVFGLVLLNIHVAQTSFRLSDLQRESAELQQEQRRLRFEVARAESPEKIAEMSASLGLVAPPSQEFLEGPATRVVDSEPVVEEIAPAAATGQQGPAAAQTAGSGR